MKLICDPKTPCFKKNTVAKMKQKKKCEQYRVASNVLMWRITSDITDEMKQSNAEKFLANTCSNLQKNKSWQLSVIQ